MRARWTWRGTTPLTIGEFLAELGTGDWFRDYYLLPLSGAIWSTPTQEILDFPAHAMIEFFRQPRAAEPYRPASVVHGAGRVASNMSRGLAGVDDAARCRYAAGAPRRRRCGGRRSGSRSRPQGGEWEPFDEVVFATHSDDTLAPAVRCRRRSNARRCRRCKYQPNEVVLHADTSLMPKRRACWSSWVYTEDGGQDRGPDRPDLLDELAATDPARTIRCS